jgi:hypothetical protein
MPKFSLRSLKRLATCDPRLQMVAKAAIAHIDFTVLCGHRGEEEQNDAFERGTSKLRFPNSKHNAFPALAMDLAPYPIDWNDLDRFKALAMVVMDEAKHLGVKLRWGADWDRDGDWRDEKFRDWPHFEIDE